MAYSGLLPLAVNNSALYETTVTPNNYNELQEVQNLLNLNLHNSIFETRLIDFLRITNF